jgi:hypothetical protein
VDCVNTKEAFRLIQSIPSKKAEPFKQWLAQLAKERIDEIENPELVQDRVKTYYELKGYPKDWIEKTSCFTVMLSVILFLTPMPIIK